MADQAKGLSHMMERYRVSTQAAGGSDDWTEF